MFQRLSGQDILFLKPPQSDFASFGSRFLSSDSIDNGSEKCILVRFDVIFIELSSERLKSNPISSGTRVILKM